MRRIWYLGPVLALLLGGCASLDRIPFSAKDEQVATVAGLSGVRFYADAPVADIHAAINGIAANTTREHKEFTYLALSGGGADGAYGAGVLNGWTAAGTRPVFTIVSGVSTGALIAPFAFLGSQYDGLLKELYTGGYAETLLGTPHVLRLMFGSGLFGNQQFRDMVARYVNDDMLVAIAREHKKGRRLFVVTTNLDMQRAVVWDMGAIAARASPQALSLFRDVLTASASIPVVFPPILIEASANGRSFQEMHVDGAVMTPVFTLPDAFLLRSAEPTLGRRGSIYILMNNKIEPSMKVVEDNVIQIAGRSSSTAVKSKTSSILAETYNFARRYSIGFYITYIDKDQVEPTGAGFDASYMQHLYQYGDEKARSGKLWERTPPAGDPVAVRR